MPSKHLLVISLRGDVCFPSSAGKSETGAVCRTICSAVRLSSSLPAAFNSRSVARPPRAVDRDPDYGRASELPRIGHVSPALQRPQDGG